MPAFSCNIYICIPLDNVKDEDKLRRTQRMCIYLIARLSFSYVMLVLFFLRPHICATASDCTNRNTPVSLSSQRRRVGLKAESFSKSRMNSHKWFPFEAIIEREIQLSMWEYFCSLRCCIAFLVFEKYFNVRILKSNAYIGPLFCLCCTSLAPFLPPVLAPRCRCRLKRWRSFWSCFWLSLVLASPRQRTRRSPITRSCRVHFQFLNLIKQEKKNVYISENDI